MGIRTKLKGIFLRVLKGTIQKRLGYPERTKLLIIHADDLGLSGSENAASINAMTGGMVNSGSIMVPCPAFEEISEYSRLNPETDLGIHFTLTSEWEMYKWGPVADKVQVSSLVDENGFFMKGNSELIRRMILSEVEHELRAQIKRAIDTGIDLTHIDSHMFVAFSDDKILKIYIKLGKEYKLPPLFTYDLPLRYLLDGTNPVVDRLYYARAGTGVDELASYYRGVLNSLEPGLNCILVHVAYNNEESQNIMRDQPNYGSVWRQADFDFFAGEECRRLLQDNNIVLITWREIRDRLIRNG